jgi:hypothetical protein
MFSVAIVELTKSWESYRAGKTTKKDHPVHKLVVDEIPEILKSWTPNSPKYKFIGSDGQGNILRTPWFATLNLEITDSATKGYYMVYLLSSDLKTLVLEIGFGATQFENQYGRGKKFTEALSKAVANMRVNSAHLIDKALFKTKANTNIAPVILDESGDYNLGDYGKCAIYSLTYNTGNLPPEEDLKRDYLEYAKLYDLMTESLLLADVDDYVYESVNEIEIMSDVQLKEFEPRVFKKKKANPESNRNTSSRRYSKKSDKVGKLGEEIVVDFEKNKLILANRPDLAEKVNWHRDDATNRTPGWDITSFDTEGGEIFIEVKSSESKRINDVELTINEWVQAEKNIKTGRYKVYLVSNVFSSPVVEIVENPALMVEKREFSLNIVRYQLELGTTSD